MGGQKPKTEIFITVGWWNEKTKYESFTIKKEKDFQFKVNKTH